MVFYNCFCLESLENINEAKWRLTEHL
jgi:hypothetical protein